MAFSRQMRPAVLGVGTVGDAFFRYFQAAIGRGRSAAVALAAVAVLAFPAAGRAADRVPNDPYFSQLKYLSQIGVPEAWNWSLGFEGMPVAVIDSGVDIDHPDLKSNIWRNMNETPGNNIDDDQNGYVDDVFGWDFVGGDNDPRPEFGDYDSLGISHGTVNAGVIAAAGDNGQGIVGVTWQASIMALRALDSDGSGELIGVVQAIEYAVKNGAKVINLSFTGTDDDQLLKIALRRAYDAGVFVVVAAGNAPEGGEAVDLDRQPLYPVCLDQGADENFIYGVAAVDDLDHKADFSNFGAGCVDISAPGTRFLSTTPYRPSVPGFELPYGGYFNGTSLAAPVVSGVVALIRAIDRNLTPKQIMNLLTQSAFNIDALNPGYFGKLGRGRIDAAKALSLVAGRKTAVSKPVTTASLLPAGGGSLIAAAPGPGRPTEIRLFTVDGLFVRSWPAFAEGFSGGASLAAGDFNGSGRYSIVAGAGAGGSPQVRVFNVNSETIGQFPAFDERFRGGVNVATGDIDADGRDEIVAAAGPGGGPHIRLFEADSSVSGGFFAFEKSFRGGVSVAAGDVDGDGRDEIVAAAGSGRQAAVRIFDRTGRQLSEFFPFGRTYRAGIRVSVADIDDDGALEILVRGLTGRRQAAFRRNGVAETLPAGFAFETGVTLTSSSGQAAGVFNDGEGGQPTVAVRRTAAASPVVFSAFEQRFRGGVRVAVLD